MQIKKFIIEFYTEYEESKDAAKNRKRKETKAGEFAVRKYLDGQDSPLKRYSFNGSYTVHNKKSDIINSYVKDEIMQINSIVSRINAIISKEDVVVIHLWGHAYYDGIGATSYYDLVNCLNLIHCSHLYINLMSSCCTIGAQEYGNGFTTIWFSKDGVPDYTRDDFDCETDLPENHTLNDDAKAFFEIPFLIYDCWDDKNANYDFNSFLDKVQANKGIVDLYGKTGY